MLRLKFSALALCFAVTCWLTSSLLAQTTVLGRISGTVTDVSGAVLPGASVTVTNEETGQSRTVTTNQSGFYVVTNLPVGTYSVSAEQKGFSRATRRGYGLDADARVTADVALQPGKVSETVEVSSTVGETVNTISGEVSRTVDKQQVQNLALNGRNYMQLVSLVPGVVQVDEDQIAVTYGVNITNQSVNGSRTDQNLLTVDGGFNLDSGSNGSPINNVGIDFIQEVAVKTSNFSAEYGRNAGSAINVVTRSGTNDFHGGVFEFLRNNWFDATNYFTPVCTPASPCPSSNGLVTDGRKNRQVLRFNDFGWDLGGPIKKNRLFFFGGEEWKYIRQNSAPTRLTLPTATMLSGNFSGISTTLKKPANAPAGCTITANVLSPQCITADGQAIAKLYQAMANAAGSYNGSASSNNTIYQPFQPYDWRQDIARLDYRINDNQTVYFRYLHDNFLVFLPSGFSCASTIPSCPENRKRPGYSYQLSHTWVINPKLVNQASINAAWNGQRLIPVGDSWKRSTYGFTFPQVYGATGGGRYRNSIPDISITGYAGVKGQSHALLSPTTDISPSDTLTWTHENHTVKTGVLIVRNRKDQNARTLYAGQVTFQTTGNANTTGNAFADALMGNFQDYQEASDDPVGLFRFTQYQAFVSDDWRVFHNLSLELGLRWQYAVPTYTLGNDIANFDPAAYDPSKAVTVTSSGAIDTTKGGNPLDGLVRAGSGVPGDQLSRYPNGQSPAVLAVPAGAPRGFYKPQNLFAPRVGFAWSPFGNDRTAVRGGFGVFYDTPEGNIIFPLLSNPPFIQSVDLTSGNLSNPLAGKPAAASVMGGISAIATNMKMSYTMSYSVGVQHEFGKGFFLETSYIGNQQRHLIRKPDINQPSLADLIAHVPASGNISSGTVNFLRPYKGYSAINMFMSDSMGNYNAIQTYLTRRKGNLLLSVGYTFARALTDSTSITDTNSDAGAIALIDRRYSYGPSPYNRAHVFVATYTYSLPFYRGQEGFTGHVLGGWELSGINRLQSGEPFTVRGQNALGTLRADYIGGPISIPDPTPDHWFNTAAFAVAPVTRPGTASVGQVLGPGLFTWDLSLRKRVRLPSERFELRLQADMFNVLNHTNFRFDSLSSLTPNATTITNASYGTVSAAGPPRQIQLGVKFNF